MKTCPSRRTHKILPLLLALALAGSLAACQNQPAASGEGQPEQSVIPSSQPASQQEPGAPAVIPTSDPAVLTLYPSCTIVTYGAEVVSDTLYLPVERDISQGLTPELFTRLVTQCGPYYTYDGVEITAVSIEDEGALVEINALTGEEDLDRDLLNTIAMTLLENCDAAWVSFMEADRGTPALQQAQEDSGRYTPPALRIPELSREEIAALRQSVPYEDVVEKTRAQEEALKSQVEAEGGVYDDGTVPLDAWNIGGDETAKELNDYIADVTRLNIPQGEFDTLAEAPGDFILMAAIVNTPCVYWDGYGGEGAPDYPQLAPLSDVIGDYQCYLQEHVEMTARRLFGEDVAVTHTGGGLSPWKYHEYAGVYTPPHMGTPYPVCYLLD